MEIPKVFISYSHDSPEHKKWVLELATKLRVDGIDAIIDLWELKAGADLPAFMEKHLKDSDFTLMVCTENYVKKANAGIGGVGYEKMIITSDLMRNIDSNKVIPIIRQIGTHEVPTFLKTKKFIDLSHKGVFDFGYDELIRTILSSPLYIKPKIGNNPFGPSDNVAVPKKSNDSLKKLMTIVIKDYNSGCNIFYLNNLSKLLGVSRILFDLLIEEAISKRLIKKHVVLEAVELTREGKSYAVENSLT